MWRFWDTVMLHAEFSVSPWERIQKWWRMSGCMNRAARDSNLVTQNYLVHYQHTLWYPRGETEENDERYATVAHVLPTFEPFASPKVKLVTAVLNCVFLHYWPLLSSRLNFSVGASFREILSILCLTVGRADSSSVEDRGKYPEHGGLTEFGKVSATCVNLWRETRKLIINTRTFSSHQDCA